MSRRILITGSAGLVGRALCGDLAKRGFELSQLDVRAPGHSEGYGDVREFERVRAALAGCEGVVHLAAVSRVIWAEQDPELCMSTNVPGLENVLRAICGHQRRPWLVFASSREVYGQPARLPASEDAPLQPVNVYGRSKVEGERLVESARREGVRAAIVRLSNVFGSTSDYPDRVVPAFARAVVEGAALRVDGSDHTFDFTHIDDVSRGLVLLVELLGAGESPPPPIHFVTGTPTTLGELASMARSLAESASNVRIAPPRSFDVARFYGDPTRARALLGWAPEISLARGLSQLISDFRIATQPRQSTR